MKTGVSMLGINSKNYIAQWLSLAITKKDMCSTSHYCSPKYNKPRAKRRWFMIQAKTLQFLSFHEAQFIYYSSFFPNKTYDNLAQELHMGVRTVETHARKAFEKLGFHNRLECRAWLNQNPTIKEKLQNWVKTNEQIITPE